ncbi:MAG: EF-hand domain-containing protein [Pseudomonadota bacterium]
MRANVNMKYIALTGGLALAIAVGTAVGGAAEQIGRDGKGARFEALDSDGDGRVTRAELDAHMKARFDRSDANGDGVLSRNELLTQAQNSAEARLERRIARMDTNSDGAISFDEMKAARGDRLFERADTDKNGAIDQAEFDQMRAQAREKRESRLQ